MQPSWHTGSAAPSSPPGRAALCLDRRVLGRAEGTGVATYAANLACAAADLWAEVEYLQDAAMPPAPARATPRLARLRRWAAALPISPRAADLATTGTGLRVAPDVFRVAQVHFDLYGRYLPLCSARPPTVMHWTYPLPLRLRGALNIVTVHDLIPLLLPGLSPVPAVRARRMLMRLRREADHIVTVSEASRRQIIATLDWPADRVTNTYQSIEPPAWTGQEAADATARETAAAGLAPGTYLLHVGTVERRKNIGRLIAAWRESGACSPLVIAGPDGWHAADELREADASACPPPGQPPGQRLGPRLVRLPWMKREALLALMNGARALLAPSLAEGFGLPAVEAMALGVPVLTSAVDATGAPGAAAEIAGDAAMLVDPRDIRALARAIAALDADPDLRGALALKGLARAVTFSREAYAGRLRALYADRLRLRAVMAPVRD